MKIKNALYKNIILRWYRILFKGFFTLITVGQIGSLTASAAVTPHIIDGWQLQQEITISQLASMANFGSNNLTIYNTTASPEIYNASDAIINLVNGEALTASFSPKFVTPAQKIINLTITAYASTPEETDSTPFVTALGTHTHDGIVATNLLPFSTKIRLPLLFGNKVFTVEDRMNARFTDRIDVWMSEAYLAQQFGVKKTVVEIL